MYTENRITIRKMEIDYVTFKLVGEKLGRKCFQYNRIKKEQKVQLERWINRKQ